VSGHGTPAWGLASSITAPVLLIGGWTLAAALRPGDDFSSVSDSISALAAHDAPHRWIMTAALAGVGLAHLITATALRTAPRLSRAVLALGGLATAGVAAAPLGLSAGGDHRHAVVATVAFLSLALWTTPWRPGAGPGRAGWVVTALLVAELAWFFSQLTTGGPLLGLSERVAAGSQALWPLAVVVLVRRRERVRR